VKADKVSARPLFGAPNTRNLGAKIIRLVNWHSPSVGCSKERPNNQTFPSRDEHTSAGEGESAVAVRLHCRIPIK